MKKLSLSIILFFLFSSLIMNVHATFDATKMPEYLDNQINVGTFVAGLILTCFGLALVIFPLIYLTNGKAYSLYVIVSLTFIAPFTALGWFPVWLYIVVILAIAFGFAKEIASFIGGLRK